MLPCVLILLIICMAEERDEDDEAFFQRVDP
jgi:hypothetical protein